LRARSRSATSPATSRSRRARHSSRYPWRTPSRSTRSRTSRSPPS
jgi:hypothetical protein